MKEVRALFGIAVVVALVMFLFLSTEARFDGRQCYYNSECVFDEEHHGYRYYQCFGSYAAYSGWRYDGRCMDPALMPRKLFNAS